MNTITKSIIVLLLLINLSSLVWGYGVLNTKLITNRGAITDIVTIQTRKKALLEKEISVLEQSRIEQTINLKSLQKQTIVLDKQLTKEGGITNSGTTNLLTDQKSLVKQEILTLEREQNKLLQSRNTVARAVIRQRLAQQAVRRTRSS